MHPAFAVCCERCGETVDPQNEDCPHCGNLLADCIAELRRGRLIEINVKDGWRSSAYLLDELLNILDSASRLRLPGFVLIHGYGSGGRGGRLREETRRELDALQARGMIRRWYAGESIQRAAANIAADRSLRRRLARYSGNDGTSVVLL